MLHFLTENTRRISCVWWVGILLYVVQGVSPLVVDEVGGVVTPHLFFALHTFAIDFALPSSY